MNTIQLFRPTFRTEECLQELKECLDKGWTGLGFKTIEFENQWKAYTKLPFAHFLNSATAGLHLAFKILKEQYGWSNDNEVITTPFTFVSTNHAILYSGLRPVFADIDDSLCLDPVSVESKITPRTKAIVYVGIGGNAANLEQIISIARNYKLRVVLDAAHMTGTWVNGRHVGSDVDVAVFSFQAVKNLPTGDSGMICFSLAELDKRARQLSWLGIDKDTFERTANQGSYKWRYSVDDVGYKYHGNSIMAAIGIVSLRYVEQDNERRRKICSMYFEGFKNCDSIKVIEHIGCVSSRHLFQIAVENRDSILDALNAAGINVGVHYITNTDYKPFLYAKGTCPKAEYYSKRILSLPLHIQLTNEDVERVISVTCAAAVKARSR